MSFRDVLPAAYLSGRLRVIGPAGKPITLSLSRDVHRVRERVQALTPQETFLPGAALPSPDAFDPGSDSHAATIAFARRKEAECDDTAQLSRIGDPAARVAAFRSWWFRSACEELLAPRVGWFLETMAHTDALDPPWQRAVVALHDEYRGRDAAPAAPRTRYKRGREPIENYLLGEHRNSFTGAASADRPGERNRRHRIQHRQVLFASHLGIPTDALAAWRGKQPSTIREQQSRVRRMVTATVLEISAELAVA